MSQDLLLGPALDLNLASDLAALARIGSHVRTITIAALDVRGRETSGSAALQIMRHCAALEAVQMPADQSILIDLQGQLWPNLQVLYLNYAVVTKRSIMGPVLAARSMPGLRSIALQRYAVKASEAWALFSALSCTAVDSITLQQCRITDADMDVAVEARAGTSDVGALVALASDAADDVAAIVLCFYTVSGFGLAGGPDGDGGGWHISQSQLNACEVETLAIDHFSAARLATFAACPTIRRLYILLRRSSADFVVLSALSAVFKQTNAFQGLRTIFIQYYPTARSTWVRTDDSLGEVEMMRLEREAAALEETIWAEILRRGADDGRRWTARPPRVQEASLMAGLIQPGIITDVRRVLSWPALIVQLAYYRNR